jgi:hypothetical protein
MVWFESSVSMTVFLPMVRNEIPTALPTATTPSMNQVGTFDKAYPSSASNERPENLAPYHTAVKFH